MFCDLNFLSSLKIRGKIQEDKNKHKVNKQVILSLHFHLDNPTNISCCFHSVSTLQNKTLMAQW